MHPSVVNAIIVVTIFGSLAVTLLWVGGQRTINCLEKRGTKRSMAILRDTDSGRSNRKHRGNLLRGVKRCCRSVFSTDTAAIPILLAATGVTLTFYSIYKDFVALYGAN